MSRPRNRYSDNVKAGSNIRIYKLLCDNRIKPCRLRLFRCISDLNRLIKRIQRVADAYAYSYTICKVLHNSPLYQQTLRYLFPISVSVELTTLCSLI